MKFKILKGTTTYKKLREFDQKVKDQHQMLLKLMEDFGADAYSPPSESIFNSKLSFQFKNGKPQEWKVYDKSMNLYVPKVKTSFEHKVKELPTLIDHHTIGKIINFSQDFVDNKDGSKTYTLRPRIRFVKSLNLYIVNTGNGQHDCDDMIEILESEFNELAEL